MTADTYLIKPSLAYKDCSLDELAIKASQEKEAKEEIYRCLNRLIKIKFLSFLKRGGGDESEVLYEIYLASERTLKFYQKSQGSFLSYWNCSIEKSLKSYQFKYFSKMKRKNTNECQINNDYELPFFNEEVKDSWELYQKVKKHLTTYENALFLLYLGGYASLEIEKALWFEEKKVLSTIKNILIKLKNRGEVSCSNNF